MCHSNRLGAALVGGQYVCVLLVVVANSDEL